VYSSWNPSFFMTDYSEAELLAIEQVFPSTKSFLCDSRIDSKLRNDGVLSTRAFISSIEGFSQSEQAVVG